MLEKVSISPFLWQAMTWNCNRKGSIKLLHGCCLSTIMWKRSSKKIPHAQHKTNINVSCWRKGISLKKFTWKATIMIELTCLKKKNHGTKAFAVLLSMCAFKSLIQEVTGNDISNFLTLWLFIKVNLLNALRSIKYFSEASWVMTVNCDH